MSLIESLLNKTNEELIDLRGFPFSAVLQTEEDKRTRLGKYNQQIHKEPLILTDLSFERYDFSGALFGETTWIDCRFSHCIFSNLRFLCSRFVGCKFHRTNFIDCQNDAIFLDLGRDKRCEFDECRFIRGEFVITVLYYPSFSKCFFKLDMNLIDFQGSQFSDCTFEGRLNGVTFRGRKDPSRSPVFRDGKEVPENTMMNVDFTKSKLELVHFRDSIDLTNCLFPDQEDLIVIKDAKRILKKAIEIIDREWEGEDRRLAKASIWRILEKLEKKDQPIEVMSISSLHGIQNELEHRKLEYPEEKIKILLRSLMPEN